MRFLAGVGLKGTGGLGGGWLKEVVTCERESLWTGGGGCVWKLEARKLPSPIKTDRKGSLEEEQLAGCSC